MKLTLMLLALSSAATGKETAMERNKAVIKRFDEQFKQKANLTVIEETHAGECVFHMPDPSVRTRDGVKALGGAIFKAFPDVNAKVEELLAIDDKVIERTVVTATHQGEFSGVPATNKPVQWTELHIYKLKEGKVVEQWSEINMLAILAQIGALPPPPAKK